MNDATIYLLHGAGAGHQSDFLVELKSQLSLTTGLEVIPITLDYMKVMEETSSRRPPPKFEKLVEEVKSVIPENQPCFIVGKSMGARIATQLTESHNVKGVVCFGFPFYPTKKPEKNRLSYLAAVTKPCLIFQGTKDSLGNFDWVDQQVLSSLVDIEWIDGANHDFKRAKKYNMSINQLICEMTHTANTWMAQYSL
ncbi:alpha/beta family hydrolase [Marinomonas balearica]|uniref:KANL3/Tex30 alpha/beta hydrolase-like domain-containing protein n=1 Tax=Marinomonas balearica TaxID=491947 RepID=A0A4R6M660_9GAMM|nr:alpha/beta family hydrolase [Marinomonas balearica]TDO96754.1 hypothetical protein DFP79_2522 [Marinomonas balearica]